MQENKQKKNIPFPQIKISLSLISLQTTVRTPIRMFVRKVIELKVIIYEKVK